jgi:transposase
MSTFTKSEPATWREGRRFRAWELHQQGWLVGQIATALGVTHGAVSQWLKRARSQGVAALARRPQPGHPPRLTPDQQAQVPTLLRRGAKAWGFPSELWTRQRIATLLQREFGVQYSLPHLSRLLARWGWTRQKPVRQARQRDAAKVREWREEVWPEAEKKGHK